MRRCFGCAILTPLLLAEVFSGHAQSPVSTPLAIVPLPATSPGHEDEAPHLSGALEVVAGRALIVAQGSTTSGTRTTEAQLPRRGTLRVCAATTLKLAADHSIALAAGEVPGLMMAMDHGAIEASFATARNADLLMTPDFRILISGPGSADLRVRIGQHGDTCVENAGTQAPYVLVSSVFEDGAFQVRSGQRVMFQHGSLHEVVDTEKEPCGCPPAETHGNEFPLAQSEGLAPLANPAEPEPGSPASRGEITEFLSHEGSDKAQPKPEEPPQQPTAASKPKPKSVFQRMKKFLRSFFGADEQ